MTLTSTPSQLRETGDALHRIARRIELDRAVAEATTAAHKAIAAHAQAQLALDDFERSLT